MGLIQVLFGMRPLPGFVIHPIIPASPVFRPLLFDGNIDLVPVGIGPSLARGSRAQLQVQNAFPPMFRKNRDRASQYPT